MLDNNNDQRKSSGKVSNRRIDFSRLSYDQVTKHVWKETYTTLKEAVGDDQLSLLWAEPGCGKTTAAFHLLDEFPGIKMTYVAGRQDLYQAAVDKAKEYGGLTEDEILVAPAPHRDCPVFQDDSKYVQKQALMLYEMGISAMAIHASEDIPMPCQNPICPYIRKLEYDVDEYRLFIGFYNHLKNTKKIKDRIVIIDEFQPDAFETVFGPKRLNKGLISVPKAIDGFLRWRDDIPYQSYEQLILDKEKGKWIPDDILTTRNILEDTGVNVAATDLLQAARKDNLFHTSAPTFVYDLTWMSKPTQDTGFHVTPFDEPLKDFPYDDAHRMLRKPAETPQNDELYMLRPVDISAAKSVVALDGTPMVDLWNTLFQQDFTIHRVLEDNQRMEYLEEVQDIEIVQVENPQMKPYARKENVSAEKDMKVTVTAVEEYGSKACHISTKAGLECQREFASSFYDDIVDLETNYGAIKSSNDMCGKPLLVIHGCRHPGDDLIQKWGHYAGHAITRAIKNGEMARGNDLEYEPAVGEHIFKNFVHQEVTQAILRVRNSEDQHGHSVVIVNTSMLDDWIQPAQTLSIDYHPVTGLIGKKLYQYVSQADGWFTSRGAAQEIYDKEKVESSLVDRVKQKLNQFEDRGLIKEETTVEKGCIAYSWLGFWENSS